jgi:uncharacterized membrane protein SirB2
MSILLLLKKIHILLAVLSGIGFAVRGFIRLVMQRQLAHPMVKVGPHVIDTLLLLSGVALWLQMGYPLRSWLGLKLALVVAYIGLGITSFRIQARGPAIGIYLLALAVFVCIAFLAVHKPVI